jgi:hypothetical protein
MAMIVRAFPVLPGKEQAARDFAALVGDSRRDEAAAFYKRYGVTRESWHLQKTQQGAFIIVVTELGASPPVQTQAQAYASSQGSFDRWFKDNVRELCGVNADEQPLGPPTETLFDWAV